MSNLFYTLEIEAFRRGLTPRTNEAREWFRKRAQAMRRVNRRELMKEEPIRNQNNIMPGDMAMFFYDPKTKATLPYYDTFPLVIMIGKAPGGFYGLNLHYLPPILRAKFLDGLLEVTNNRLYDETTKFQISYSMLQRASKMRYFKPCFKHYLTNNVQSRFAKIDAPEWEIATFLPTAQFQKGSVKSVYADARSAI
jgi:hypothetical protein